MNKIWRCDLKSPCVKLCESENDKHLCGIRIKDKRNKRKIYYVGTQQVQQVPLQ